jgi:hypothetical protein
MNATIEDIKADFVRNFAWNSDDSVVLRTSIKHVRCLFDASDECSAGEMYALHDYEDGAFEERRFLCKFHFTEIIHEADGVPSWVTQDPEGAWEGTGEANGNGWKGLWHLFSGDIGLDLLRRVGE